MGLGGSSIQKRRTMHTTDTDRLDAAFTLLAEVVADQNARGRPCYSAGLKPALQKRMPGFYEGRLGFTSFREFLENAASRGLVRLEPTGGPDVNVVPPGGRAVPVATGPLDRARTPHWIRSDLWRAFFDWTPGLKRVYDRKVDRAVMFPEAPNPLEDPDATALRSATESEPERFVPIEPIPMDAQTAWMSDFVAKLADGPLTQALHGALMSDRPIQAFNRVVRADPALGREWYARRLEEVENVVLSWQKEHGLTFPIREATQLPTPHLDTPGRGVPQAAIEITEIDQLRKQLHLAIDEMPLGDLLKLSIPLQYLVERR
jgi:hypothetical protein